MSALEAAVLEFTSWRQETKRILDDLCLKVKKLDSHWDRAMFEKMLQHQPGIMSSPSSLSTRVPAGLNVDCTKGHDSASITRDSGQGSVTTSAHVLANGKPPDPPPFMLCHIRSIPAHLPSCPPCSLAHHRPTPLLPHFSPHCRCRSPHHHWPHA